MTLSVLEDHSPSANLSKCDFSYCGVSCGPSASAELLVKIQKNEKVIKFEF